MHKQAIVCSFWGTFGDVAFLSRIAQDLETAGYDTRLLIPRTFLDDARPVLQSMGLRRVETVDSTSPTLNELLELRKRNLGWWAALRMARKGYRDRKIELLATVVRILREARHVQFIIGDASSRVLAIAARIAGIPYVEASPMPYIRTRQFFLGSRYPCIGKLGPFNLLRWELFEAREHGAIRPAKMLRFLKRHDPELAEQWHALVVSPSSRDGDRRPEVSYSTREINRVIAREIAHFVSASPIIIPKPADWGDNVRCLGYPPWPVESLQPSEELIEFLDAGSPPLYLGFGTYGFVRFSRERGRRFLRRLAAAADALGERLVFHSLGTDAAELPDMPANLFCVGGVSHSWLFPRCKAVICHGGYGTIHSALVARKPLAIYPFQTDQFFLARRMEQLGVAVPYRATFKNFSVRRFARDVAQLGRDARLRRRAEELGAMIELEDGPGNHIAAIEELFGTSAPRGAELVGADPDR